MATFPCPLERTVASALLLLSTSSHTSPSSFSSDLSPTKFYSEEDFSLYDQRNVKSCKEGSGINEFKSCSSSLSDEVSSDEIQSQRMRINSAVSRCQEMKLNVVRKSRSKLCRCSDCKEIIYANVAKIISSKSGFTEASCLSSSSSAESSARSSCQTGSKDFMTNCDERRKPAHIGSVQLHLRADAILSFLSNGCASEVRIRQVLGDSPDTSKALRMLLKAQKVRRSGAGGRHDPYIYRTVENVGVDMQAGPNEKLGDFQLQQ